MIVSLFEEDVQPQPDVRTMDVWGVRAIHDAFGAERAARQVRHLVTLGINGVLDPIATDSGIGTGTCSYTPNGSHGVFSMRIDHDGDWMMIGDALSALERAAQGIPDTVLAGITGQPVGEILKHPWLDDGMIIDQVVFKGEVIGFILTGVSRTVDEMLSMLDRGMRP